MSEASARYLLQHIQAGQAQKELAHNEALARVDALLHPCLLTVGENGPPSDPQLGEEHAAGPSPIGEWQDRPWHIACWTDGGWRFVAPRPGLLAWHLGEARWIRWAPGGWTATWAIGSLEIGGLKVVGARQPAIASPTGGTTIDAEARTALAAILSALRGHGLIATP